MLQVLPWQGSAARPEGVIREQPRRSSTRSLVEPNRMSHKSLSVMYEKDVVAMHNSSSNGKPNVESAALRIVLCRGLTFNIRKVWWKVHTGFAVEHEVHKY